MGQLILHRNESYAARSSSTARVFMFPGQSSVGPAIVTRALQSHPAAGRVARRAREVLGDVAGAVRDLKSMAMEFIDANRAEDAMAPLNEAARLDPGDVEVQNARARLLASRGVLQSADGAHGGGGVDGGRRGGR